MAKLYIITVKENIEIWRVFYTIQCNHIWHYSWLSCHQMPFQEYIRPPSIIIIRIQIENIWLIFSSLYIRILSTDNSIMPSHLNRVVQTLNSIFNRWINYNNMICMIILIQILKQRTLKLCPNMEVYIIPIKVILANKIFLVAIHYNSGCFFN